MFRELPGRVGIRRNLTRNWTDCLSKNWDDIWHQGPICSTLWCYRFLLKCALAGLQKRKQITHCERVEWVLISAKTSRSEPIDTNCVSPKRGEAMAGMCRARSRSLLFLTTARIRSPVSTHEYADNVAPRCFAYPVPLSSFPPINHHIIICVPNLPFLNLSSDSIGMIWLLSNSQLWNLGTILCITWIAVPNGWRTVEIYDEMFLKLLQMWKWL